ncbi:MAG: shikimate 5-dehydrogenase [Candidatus Nanopelagicales bacterium]
MAREISKEMTLCVSLSARPSNIGTRFHNFLFEALELPFLYKAFAPASLEQAVQGMRGLPIRGAGISMPYKAQVIPLLDELDPTAAGIGAVNTIVNDGGRLTGYNTDVIAVERLLAAHQVRPDVPLALIGSGGMASACAAALARAGFDKVTVVARNQQAGTALANRHGWSWEPIAEPRFSTLLNATPVGMAGGAESERLPVPDAVVEQATTVFDVVAVPERTPLLRLAAELGKQCIVGGDVMSLQAVEQFERYTGVRPSEELVAAATAFSRLA